MHESRANDSGHDAFPKPCVRRMRAAHADRDPGGFDRVLELVASSRGLFPANRVEGIAEFRGGCASELFRERILRAAGLGYELIAGKENLGLDPRRARVRARPVGERAASERERGQRVLGGPTLLDLAPKLLSETLRGRKALDLATAGDWYGALARSAPSSARPTGIRCLAIHLAPGRQNRLPGWYPAPCRSANAHVMLTRETTMEPSQWSEAEARCFLEGMKTVATLRGTRPLDPLAAEMLDAVRRHVLHASMGLDDLQDSTPALLAANIEDPRHRIEFVQFLVLMPYLDMQIDAAQVAVVDEIAEALGVGTDTLTDLHLVREGRLKRLFFDYGRRSLNEFGEVEGTWDALKLLTKSLHQSVGDKRVAERYQALEGYPEGSLGHTVFHFYRARGFPLPGEKKSFTELLITHDCCHILGGFNTDMNGEMDVAGFEAGLFESGFGFELLLEVILDFHLGKAFTTLGLLPPGTGHFDPEAVLVGYERGVACNVNPIQGWDFWAVAKEQVTNLRKRYGLPEIPGPVLPPPPAAIDTAPDHEHAG